MRQYKTKLHAPHTDKVIFLDAVVLRGKIDPDPIGEYTTHGGYSQLKKQENQVNQILRGLK